MKTSLLLAFIALFHFMPVNARTPDNKPVKGKLCKELNYKSALLGYEVHYSVYLPPDYATSGKRYPVMYLLHGFNGSNKSWIKQGKINKIMDKGIAKGEIAPMILVIPDGKYWWYINDYQSKGRYEDFMFKEFLPYIDNNYRTIVDKEHRAVGGLSMGGYGSLVWAMHYPSEFSYCVALSASMFTREAYESIPDQLYKYMSMLYGAPGATGKDRITRHFLENNPVEMAQRNSADSLRSVNWFIECGRQDQLSSVNQELHEILLSRDIGHIYHSRNGRHDWKFWREGIEAGLRYISEGLRER